MNTDTQNGFDALATEGRIDCRLRREGAYTDDELAGLREELDAFRRSSTDGWGSAVTWRAIANKLNIGPTTLTEFRSGKYKGDNQRLARIVDQFLADERARVGRFDGRTFTFTDVVKRAWGAMQMAIRQNSMAAVIAEPGDGKTMLARAFASEREGALFIRIDETSGTSPGVTAMLCTAIGTARHSANRGRLASIVEYFRKVRTAVLLVDEAQKLKKSGLETIRDIHDASDPEGRRNVPVVFFGDHGFYRLIVRSRSGESSPIQPQLSRRIYPIFDYATDGCSGGDGNLFTVSDIVKILQNERLRVVTDAGVRWLCTLANVRGWGSLGCAMAVARTAIDITSSLPVDVEDLQRALRMMIGPTAILAADEAAGGALLRVRAIA